MNDVDLREVGDCLAGYWRSLNDGEIVTDLVQAIRLLGNAGHTECAALMHEHDMLASCRPEVK